MALSSAQIVRIVIFLKEAAAHIDNARLVAQRAADRRTEERSRRSIERHRQRNQPA